jgi:hypothetical protein
MVSLATCFALTSPLGLAGCSAGRHSACYPSPLHLSSQRVRAGTDVTLASTPFACNASYPVGKVYAVVLAAAGRPGPTHLADVPVQRDGSFRATIRIPAGASPGESAVSVLGSRFDLPCKDTVATSCASYAIGLTILADRA